MKAAELVRLSIAKDFSGTPGARKRSEGKFSGEEFLETVLLPQFDGAVARGAALEVDLDGGYGYSTSFLEEAFGGLARIRGIHLVLKHLQLVSLEEPYLSDEVLKYIREATG